VLVTSAVEIAVDSTTSVSLILLSNAYWPEAFLPLSNVVGGALHMRKDLSQTTTCEMGHEAKEEVDLLTYLVPTRSQACRV
jgi:hypothetical protein